MSEETQQEKALFRFQVLSPLLALDLPRGKKRAALRELAGKTWTLQNGENLKVSEESIRRWLRLYREGGFEAIKDRPHPPQGGRLPEDVIAAACRLKREVPERTLDRLIVILEETGEAPPGLIARSTLHRALQEKGLSRRAFTAGGKKDLARWQADYANDLWQSDLLEGPALPDPDCPDKKKKTRLYAFLDDASRRLLYGRFFFKGDLPALELTFKTALQKYGIPRFVYYDNGLVYRSGHMRIICAELGIHHPIHTKPYRPEGHGKIEAWNRFCTTNFLAEVKASSIQTLEELNRAFNAWVEEEYNRRTHTELKCSPKERWMKDVSRVRYVDEEKLRTVFLWREIRRADKCAMVSLFGEGYRVSPELAGRKVEVRYHPEHLDQVEIWLQGKFKERVRSYRSQRHRPPIETIPQEPDQLSREKTDYLVILTKKHEERNLALEGGSSAAFEEFQEIFRARLSPDILDVGALRRFWTKFSPVDTASLSRRLDALLSTHPNSLHLSFYLERMEGGEKK